MPAFEFKDFGTFAGPQHQTGSYNYDEASKEGFWYQDIPTDTAFKNSDLGAYLYHKQGDYVGFHCDGTSTQQMTLEASYGNIPVFNVLAERTNVNGDIFVTGDIEVAGDLKHFGSTTQTGSFTLNGKNVEAEIQLAKTLPAKPFDIPHPSKEGWRLRHISLEGPEIGVYYRGKMKDTNIINLPEYWEDLIDTDTISVNLTPMGTFQELFVKKIEWGKRVIVMNSAGGPVNCYYTVFAKRKDLEPLVVEYEGESVKDYPGQDFLGVK